MRQFVRDPGMLDAPMPDSLRAACVELGRLLLPPELRSGRAVRLYVTAEGSIARLPFEALDVGVSGQYVPVLACHDVVYARPEPLLERRTGDGTSVILLGDDRLQESSPRDGLLAVEDEARRAGERLPRARIVRSSEISKQVLLRAWAHASLIYVASHLVRDPEAPLLCHFPMRFGARQYHPEDLYLDLRDARSVDLSGCELAVLSSCASGQPYVFGGRTGPSMSDALLDAGANAVIHTRWQVRDERAAIVAPRLAEAWLEGHGDPVAAWCASRRSMLGSAPAWRHPFEWAAWSLTQRLPSQPWHPSSGHVMAYGPSRGPRVHAGPAANPELSRLPR
jgi:CHAT domain-containing protein